MSSRRRQPPPAGSSAPFSPFEVMDEVTPHRQMSSTAANPASLATSPFSPFPFGTPITHSRRSVLNPGPIQNAGGGNVTVDELQQTRKLTPIQTRVRLRGRDMYGGKTAHIANRQLHRTHALCSIISLRSHSLRRWQRSVLLRHGVIHFTAPRGCRGNNGFVTQKEQPPPVGRSLQRVDAHPQPKSEAAPTTATTATTQLQRQRS